MTEIDFIQPKKTVGKLISVDVLDKILDEIWDIDDEIVLNPNTAYECGKHANKALEQEPTDDATLKDIFCMGCEY